MKDYYKILGIDKDASQSDIKKSYRKLSKLYHPDMGKEASDDKFKDISEAYSVLSDETKRKQYDNPSSNNPFDDIFGSRQEGGFGDFFSSFFNGGNNSRSTRYDGNHRNNIRIRIDITLDEVESLSTKKIKYKRKDECNVCDGKGGQTSSCNTCNGSGSVITETTTPLGKIRQQSVCHMCGGKGFKIVKTCGTCKGEGHSVINEELDIKIPAGVSQEILYKYNGKGNSNKYGTGDLHIQFNIVQHKIFVEQGINLLCEIGLPFNLMITGGEIELPLLNNKKVKLKIPKMVKPGHRLRIKGSGLVGQNNSKGDVIVTVYPNFPSDITDEELEIIKKLEGKPNFIYNQNNL